MDTNQTKQLKDIILYGVAMDMLQILTHATVKYNKSDSLNKIQTLFSEILKGLTDEEKKWVYDTLTQATNQKADAFAQKTGGTFTQEEVTQLINEIKQSGIPKVQTVQPQQPTI